MLDSVEEKKWVLNCVEFLFFGVLAGTMGGVWAVYGLNKLDFITAAAHTIALTLLFFVVFSLFRWIRKRSMGF